MNALPVILIAALVQGWCLYALHHALDLRVWPATSPAWLIALYSIVVIAPLTLELLAKHARNRTFWAILTVLTGLFFYFGWYEGALQLKPPDAWRLVGDEFDFAFPAGVLWLLMLPFIQGRLDSGGWRVPYATLFAIAWRNKLVLAEAGLFTGLFWLLLELWQLLFHMLSIDFFRELFEEPLFVYPVTSITFGIALHLIGSIDRLTSVVLEQLLNVLKWLAVVAGTLLGLFAVALAVKLPGLVSSGHHAIGATWLLWLVAVMVLLLNAAYRSGPARQVAAAGGGPTDGEPVRGDHPAPDAQIFRPYPPLVGNLLRFVTPLTIVIALTAFYALIVRTQQYGVTAERVWAFVVASAGLIYSIGYSMAAFRAGPWMNRIAGVNVVVALALMVTIALALTPVISPARLSANSQFARILRSQAVDSLSRERWDSPFHYLRFRSGSYGLNKLRALATLQNHPQAVRIRQLAAGWIAQQEKWVSVPKQTPEELRDIVAHIPIYPSVRTLDTALIDALVADLGGHDTLNIRPPCAAANSAGVFADLDGDAIEEFALLCPWNGPVFKNQDGTWVRVGTIAHQTLDDGKWAAIRGKLAKGDFSTVAPKWKVLEIGGDSYRVDPLQ